MEHPKALIVGGGSKFGEALAELASSEYEVHVISGSNTDADRVINIEWHSCTLDDILPHIDQDYDLILFNQNGAGGPNEGAFDDYVHPIEHWNQANFTDVQLPYYILRHINPKTSMKVCWMLTPSACDIRLRKYTPQWGGYCSAKASNFHLMYTFADRCEGNYYGLIPTHFGEEGIDLFASMMYNVIRNLEPEQSGKLINEHGETFGD
jgi:NAD(P)-dependent dehydrogenase (short-subunit alcohol dehydrogenase family)